MKNVCLYFWWQGLWFYEASGVLSLSLPVKNWQLMYKLCFCHTFHAAPQSDFRSPLAVYLVFVVLKCFCPHCTISYSSSLCLCGSVCGGCGHPNNAEGIRAVLALRVSRFIFVDLLLFREFVFISISHLKKTNKKKTPKKHFPASWLCGHCAYDISWKNPSKSLLHLVVFFHFMFCFCLLNACDIVHWASHII